MLATCLASEPETPSNADQVRGGPPPIAVCQSTFMSLTPLPSGASPPTFDWCCVRTISAQVRAEIYISVLSIVCTRLCTFNLRRIADWPSRRSVSTSGAGAICLFDFTFVMRSGICNCLRVNACSSSGAKPGFSLEAAVGTGFLGADDVLQAAGTLQVAVENRLDRLVIRCSAARTW